MTMVCIAFYYSEPEPYFGKITFFLHFLTTIPQPFWPAYMTKERFAMAKNLKMCLTAGIGSDHVDLEEALKVNIGAMMTICIAFDSSLREQSFGHLFFFIFFIFFLLQRNVTVAEVTFCNSISVAEHVVMQILCLVRNFVPAYQQVVSGGWNIADCVERSYDVEGMAVGNYWRSYDDFFLRPIRLSSSRLLLSLFRNADRLWGRFSATTLSFAISFS